MSTEMTQAIDRRTSARLSPLGRLRLAKAVHDRLLSEHRIRGGQEGRAFLVRLSMPGCGALDCALYRRHIDELLGRVKENRPLESLTLVEVLLYLERLPYVVAEPVARLRANLNRHLRGGDPLQVDQLLCDRLRYSIRHRSRAAIEQLISRAEIAA